MSSESNAAKSVTAEQVGPLTASIVDEVERVIVGKRSAIELVLAAWLADGHVLVEDALATWRTLDMASLPDRAMARLMANCIRVAEAMPRGAR